MEFLLYHTKIYGRHFAPKKNKIFSNKEAVIPNKAANEVLLIPKFIWHHLYRYSRFEWSSFWSRRRIFNPFGAFCFRIPFDISVCVGTWVRFSYKEKECLWIQRAECMPWTIESIYCLWLLLVLANLIVP